MKSLLLSYLDFGAARATVDIRRCPPQRGWFWLRDSYSLFRKNPLVFVFIYCILFLCTVVLPWLFLWVSVDWGSIAVGLIMIFVIGAIFNGGLAYAYQLADRDEDPEIEHLFIGFRHHFYELMVLGLIIMSGFVAAVFVAVFAAVITLFIAAVVVVLGARLASYVPSWSQPEVKNVAIGLSMLYAMPAFIAAFVALWFGPTLVLLRECKPWDAVRASIIGSWRNARPMTVFSLLWFLFLLPFAVPSYALLGWGVGALFAVGIILFGGALYTSYKEVFPEAAVAES